ncbi:MAG TPA: FkbM family methyltransferase, partial [Acidimicrobiales bacterium]
TAGRTIFTVVESDHDLSTIDPIRVNDLAANDRSITRFDVEVVTLDDVLTAANPPVIQFLKIDVEGAEGAVLRGLDLTVWRPRVLVIEATFPESLTPSYGQWEHLVLDRGYQYASTDGINRYYVADEESSLAPALVPANVLDNFTTESLRLINEELARLRGYIGDLERALAAGERNGGAEALGDPNAFAVHPSRRWQPPLLRSPIHSGRSRSPADGGTLPCRTNRSVPDGFC